MSAIPWWGLPLIAAVFTLAGALVAQLVTTRDEHVRNRAHRDRRWYAERREAYVTFMAVVERVVYRFRTGSAAGRRPDPLLYLDEMGPALMHVRLLASGPVRSAAMAVHLLLEKLHDENRRAVPGVDPDKHARELLIQVPLVLQQFEVAVREELEIVASPPPMIDEEPPGLRERARNLLRRPRARVSRDDRPVADRPAGT